MGLDMYLRASHYISGWKHRGEEAIAEYHAILDRLGLAHDICQESPSLTIDVTVAYWRKANAIHKWFVDTCQEGKDECQDSHVEREQLVQLRDLCKNVLDMPPDKFNALAEQVLPPQSGFFFGSTAIDEGYKQDLEDTVEQLTHILDNKKLEGCGFIYHSSW